ncbi:hypothetical protein CsSME_00053378 [Camellia sinensis var. sinensis]
MKTVQKSLLTTSLDQSMIGRGRKNQAFVAGRPLFGDGRPSFVAGRPPLLAYWPPLQNQTVRTVAFSGGNLRMHEHSSFPEAK